MRSSLLVLLAVSFLPSASGLHAQTPAKNGLANNTVLIIRHAEKPLLGTGLTREGEARAQAYVKYFEPFHEDGENFRADALYSGADSGNSIRPRLTLEPLSKTSGLPLDSTVSTKEPAKLVELLQNTRHATHPLIAWRHGAIPELLQAFGAQPTLIPNAKWPDEVYDWVIVLKFDANGHLKSSRLVHEQLAVAKN